MEPLTVPPVTTRAALRDETVSSGNGIGTPDRQPCPACGTTWEACDRGFGVMVTRCCHRCRHVRPDPQRTAKEPQSLASASLAALVDIEMRRRFPGYTGIADAMDIAARLAAAGVIVAQPATALKPCKTHGLDGHLYDCDAVRWVPYQPAPDALREAAHVVEQQGLALGRLRAAAQAYLDAEEALDTWDVAHGFVINSERDRLDGMKAEAREAMRAALEEADRG